MCRRIEAIDLHRTVLIMQHRFTPSPDIQAQGEQNMMQQIPPGHSHAP